jgi:hypothetical protein
LLLALKVVPREPHFEDYLQVLVQVKSNFFVSPSVPKMLIIEGLSLLQGCIAPLSFRDSFKASVIAIIVNRLVDSKTSRNFLTTTT